MMNATEVQEKPENPLLNLVFNIVLPVIILNQLSKRMGSSGPLVALIAALILPIGYGAFDYIKRKKRNYISLLGILNVAFTGGFALLKLDGLWFAVKEAFFPLIIGGAVYISNLMDKPLVQILFWNNNVFQIARIEERLRERHNQAKLGQLFKRATFLFSLSFFMSAFLNFVLAARIFTEIDDSLSELARSEILNQQIAQMTWQGYVVIALPMMVFVGLIMWFILRQLKNLSGLSLEEILPTGKR